MFKEKKNVMKSVRMTEKVSNYVEQFEGDGFNQKFENVVLFCLDHENSLKREIAAYKIELDAIRKELMIAKQVYKYAKGIEKAIDNFVNWSGLDIPQEVVENE